MAVEKRTKPERDLLKVGYLNDAVCASLFCSQTLCPFESSEELLLPSFVCTMSRYAAAHSDTKGPGDARPTALQIVEDEGLVGKLADKVMLVTGTSSGIGIETVRALHATGATVFATARNKIKGQKAIDDIMSTDETNKSPIHLIEMDLESFDSVRNGAEEVKSRTAVLNVLVNNAGVSFASSRSHLFLILTV